MNQPLLDYYVGILRGYLLAMKAEPQVLRALDYLLEGYKSRAGDMIGADLAEPPPAMLPPTPKPQLALPAPSAPVAAEAPPKPEPQSSRLVWTNKMVDTLKNMRAEGKKPSEIAQVLQIRTSQVYPRYYAKDEES